MPGKHISDEQRRDFMDYLANGDSVDVAASKSGLSRASGYNIVKEVKSGGKKPRARTCPDPLEGIFDSQVAPILKAVPKIRTVALWREITRLNPQLDSSVKRTFQRRVRQWRAEHGVDKEIIFRQGKEAGRMGISDFTKAASLGVTIDREALGHRLYHFRLPWSGFTYVCVVTGGESWSAFSEGLQNALGQLGGVPRECRTDSLSAAFRNLHKSEIEDVTRSYRGLCSHYGMRATRNNKGVAHENGAIESAHGHLKSEIKDALELRGSRDFGDMDSYRDFIAEAVGKINARHSARIDTERLVLRPLPKRRVADYSRSSVRVTSLSGFTLKGVFYTVPSRLIGHLVEARSYDDRVEVYTGGRCLLTLPRRRRGKDEKSAYVINYHHVIHSLRRKPMALAGLVYRGEVFPRQEYRRCFEAALEVLPQREACRLTVRLLELAHDYSCEAQLAEAIGVSLDSEKLPDIKRLRERFAPKLQPLPHPEVRKGSLGSYGTLLNTQEGS